jgi:hypothetical protein
MRSSEPALHERMREITELGRERGIPVVCNGDALGGGHEAEWGNFKAVCEKTGSSFPHFSFFPFFSSLSASTRQITH